MTACPLAHRVQIVFEEPRVCVIVQAMSKKAVTTRYTIRQPIQEQGGELSPCQGPFPRPYTAERCARNAALRNNTEEAMVKRKKERRGGREKKSNENPWKRTRGSRTWSQICTLPQLQEVPSMIPRPWQPIVRNPLSRTDNP